MDKPEKGPNQSHGAADEQIPIGSHGGAEEENHFGGGGQGGFLSLEDHDEFRQHKGEKENRGGDCHHADNNGVDHGAANLGPGFNLLALVFGNAFQHGSEGTGEFRGPDHVDIQGAEYFGILDQRFRERFAGFDIPLDLIDDGAEFGIVDLFGNAFQGGPDTDTGFDHDRQLAGKIQDILGGRPGLNIQRQQALQTLSFFLHGFRQGKNVGSLAPQRENGSRIVFRGHYTGGYLTIGLSYFIAIIRHSKFLRQYVWLSFFYELVLIP
ncbi:MAG: hypothetical protein BWY71_01084 [Planctomycetes bacterium ADurb.Bin412]|nr:MAG: hypothetical protein BWY71_01084 [Planctomycetes bacterium ADurb.Bin412]